MPPISTTWIPSPQSPEPQVQALAEVVGETLLAELDSPESAEQVPASPPPYVDNVEQACMRAMMDRAIKGTIRFRTSDGVASLGDLERHRALWGEELTREQWADEARWLGFQNPPPPNLPWW